MSVTIRRAVFGVFFGTLLLLSCGKDAPPITVVLKNENDGTWVLRRVGCDATESGVLTETALSDGGPFNLIYTQEAGIGSRVLTIASASPACVHTVNMKKIEYLEGKIRIEEEAASCTGDCTGFETSCAAPAKVTEYPFTRTVETLTLKIPPSAAADPCFSNWTQEVTFVLRKKASP